MTTTKNPIGRLFLDTNPHVERVGTTIVVDRARILEFDESWMIYAGLTGEVRKVYTGEAHTLAIILDFASQEEFYQRRVQSPENQGITLSKIGDVFIPSRYLSELDPTLDRQLLAEVRTVMGQMRNEETVLTAIGVRDRLRQEQGASFGYATPFIRRYITALEPYLVFPDWLPPEALKEKENTPIEEGVTQE